jgi:hypothetical protein
MKILCALGVFSFSLRFQKILILNTSYLILFNLLSEVKYPSDLRFFSTLNETPCHCERNEKERGNLSLE